MTTVIFFMYEAATQPCTNTRCHIFPVDSFFFILSKELFKHSFICFISNIGAETLSYNLVPVREKLSKSVKESCALK